MTVKHFQEGLSQPKVMASVILLLALLVAGAGIALADNVNTQVGVGNAAPTVSNVSFFSTDPIVLNENSFVWASTTFTVTDSNGCEEITTGSGAVEAKLFRAPLAGTSGTLCSQNDNNCYVSTDSTTCIATSTDTCTGPGDPTVDYECGFKIWYIADPTEAGSAFASDNWVVAATGTDGTDSGTATNTGETVEVNELLAHSVAGFFDFATSSPNTNTGTDDQQATTTNTGNTPIDNSIGGDDLCINSYVAACPADNIAEGQQKFHLTAGVAYGSRTFTLAASATPANIDLSLVKPTATTSAVEDTTYWGIAIPDGQATGTYKGLNLFNVITAI